MPGKGLGSVLTGGGAECSPARGRPGELCHPGIPTQGRKKQRKNTRLCLALFSPFPGSVAASEIAGPRRAGMVCTGHALETRGLQCPHPQSTGHIQGLQTHSPHRAGVSAWPESGRCSWLEGGQSGRGHWGHPGLRQAARSLSAINITDSTTPRGMTTGAGCQRPTAVSHTIHCRDLMQPTGSTSPPPAPRLCPLPPGPASSSLSFWTTSWAQPSCCRLHWSPCLEK